MDNLQFQLLGEKKLGSQTFKEFGVLRYDEDGDPIVMGEDELMEVIRLMDARKKKIKDPEKHATFAYMIKGLTPTRWSVLKSYDQVSDYNEYLQYWRGKISEKSNIHEEFYQFTISIRM